MDCGGERLLYARSVDGATIAAEVVEPAKAGGGTVLLIPGLGYGPWSWEPQRVDLSADHRLVMLHNRGTGRSDAPPGPYSIETMAHDAAAVLKTLGVQDSHVVGASMGGYIALQLARLHADLVSSVVVIASSPGGPGALAVPESTAALWRHNAHLPAKEFARRTMPHSFAPGWTATHPTEYAELLAARLSSPTQPEAWAAQSTACEDFLEHGLTAPGPHQPVTGIHGTSDRVVPYENLGLLRRRLPQAHLVTLAGSGHLCWLERPQEVNQVIRTHLTSVGAEQEPLVPAPSQEEQC